MTQGRAKALTFAAIIAIVAGCSPVPSESPATAATGSAGPSIASGPEASPSAPTPGVTPTATPGVTPSAATSSLAPSPSPHAPTHAPTTPPRVISHVVVVWMENHEVSSITSSSMPYLYGLSKTYGRADSFYAVTHPSLPNYLAFWSGSTYGVADDADYNLGGESLSSQFATAGLSWRMYAQDYPNSSGCHTASTYSGGVDGPGVAGTYARKHVPAMSFASVSGSHQCVDIQPLARFDPGVNLAFVAPNLCNDMHDCSQGTGDAFLKAFLPRVFDAPDWAHTLLVVSFDEGTSGAHGGGRVFTMVARKGLSGFRSSTVHDHYGLLRTIEDIFGLHCLRHACSAAPLTEFLR